MRLSSKHFLIFSLICIAIAIVSISTTGRISDIDSASRQAQRVFDKKEKDLLEGLKLLEEVSLEESMVEDKITFNGVTILYYKNDSLVFWSDNSMPVDLIYNPLEFQTGITKIKYKTYLRTLDSINGGIAVGLIHLSNEFPYQNQFLKNGLVPDFKQTKGVKVSKTETKVSFPISFNNGEIAFYLDYSYVGVKDYVALRIIGTLFFFLGVFFFLSFLRYLLKELELESKGRYALLVVGGLIMTRIILILTSALSNQFVFFDPFIYASKMAPTFGDLIVNTILFVFFAYLTNRYIKVPKRYIQYAFNRNAWVGILNVVFALAVVYTYYTSSSLITNSSLNLVVHNMSQLRLPIIIAYAILAANYFSLVLIALWIFKVLGKVKRYILYINIGALLAVVLLLSYTLKSPLGIYTVVFCFLIYLLVGLLKDWIKQKPILTSLVYFLLGFSVFIMLFMINLTERKEYQQNQSLAISLSTEHDPIAEYFFKEITEDLKSDTAITNRFKSEVFDIMDLYNFLSKNYFNGYWKRYELQVTVCSPADSVRVDDGDIYLYPCYDFFEEYLQYSGVQIPESDFYYIDKFTGLINYLGWVSYTFDDGEEVSIFIELDSKLTTKPLGYPELLLDEGVQRQDEYADFSHAKYYRGNLISHSGKFEYSLISDVFDKGKGQVFRGVKHNGFMHLVYQPNDDNLVVISEPIVRFIDYLVLFSYVFVFYYLSSLVIAFVFVSQYRLVNFRDSLRNRIQFSVISILIVSLLLIAGSTTWFNIRKYNQTQFRIIEEKINSVYVELEHKLAYEEILTRDWSTDKYDNLDQLLIKFSDVFYSDINLYSPEGTLIATSRNQVFDLGLQSERMDPNAFYKMSKERLARFIHREKINNLAYLSAYIPFHNAQGELLAFLNLPYFTKQKELQEDITTITVAIINIYVLLILLTIIIAVVISDQITKPLEMIQKRFRELKLGGKYEPIEYSKNDEIGRLVVEYNQMVQELEKNIELLAKSERESAWREMAKQVAHEIKNPLTPMRLSVQQLKRTWDDKRDGFDEYLNRVTETLIEQIDNLSRIAGEFSNFAKMPIAHIQKVNLLETLQAATALFKAHQNIKITLSTKVEVVWVMADMDQLSRVFINIVKNGIQAIPESEKGEIDISLKIEKENAVIHIADNGKGIPQAIVGRLFTPNFTTKSSGMGLGLAIVKNILDSIGGEINLSTELNKGTVFTVVIPIVS